MSDVLLIRVGWRSGWVGCGENGRAGDGVAFGFWWQVGSGRRSEKMQNRQTTGKHEMRLPVQRTLCLRVLPYLYIYVILLFVCFFFTGSAMLSCKRCGSKEFVKNGIVAGKQRYKCSHCQYRFREGDARTNEKIAAKKALCILLYAIAKGSFRMLGHILDTPHTHVYRWIRHFGESLPEPVISGTISEMEFDEMWHFIGQKKRNFGLSKRLIVAHGEPWTGCSAIVIVQPSDGCMTK